MKKNYIFYACTAAVLVFASCQKEAPVNDGTDVSSSDLNTVTATILQTKTTTVDGINVLWEDGDKIGLRPYSEENTNATGMVEYVTTLETNSASATFEKMEGQDESAASRNGNYIAMYPTKPKYWLWSGKYERIRVGVDVPGEQILPVGGGWDKKTSFMIATSTDGTDFAFKHVMSYIKFTVDAQSPAFDKLVISSISQQALLDRVDIYYDGRSEITSNNTYKSASVTLKTATGEAFTPGTYYAAVLPQTYEGGFSFSFFNGEDMIGNKSVDSNVVFERGDVANMGVIGSFSVEELPDPLQVGAIYAEDGVNQGVVFWVDPTNPYKGKIVSVSTSTTIQWATKNTTLGGTDTNDGLANYNMVTGLDSYKEDANNFPAMKTCADLRAEYGGNWYLPVASELQALYNAYYGLSITSWENVDYRKNGETIIDMSHKQNFDAALKLLGETDTATLDGDFNADGTSDNAVYGTANGVCYWTSKENSSDGKVQFVRFGNYQLSNTTKENATKAYVRCVRDVEAK